MTSDAAHHGTLFIRRLEIARPRAGRKVATMLVAIVNFLRAWRRYNASLKELYQLGDRELADIGITRSDIPRIAWTALTAEILKPPMKAPAPRALSLLRPWNLKLAVSAGTLARSASPICNPRNGT